MGMSLPAMQAYLQTDPAKRQTQSLAGAHLPAKGFYLKQEETARSNSSRFGMLGQICWLGSAEAADAADPA